MTRDLFVGVDGGGTKTKMRIEDSAGNLIGETRSGPAQIRISIEDAWDSINTAFHEILNAANINPNDHNIRFHAGLGLAGTESQNQYNDFINHPNPFSTICLKSDAYAACLGAHDGHDGAIIIIGTGTKGYQIEGSHESSVGGWGFPQGDEGGGGWIGLQTIRLTFHSVDGRLPKSPLFDAILAQFDNNISTLLDWRVNATSSKFGTLAPTLIEYVDKKDPFAIQIIQEAAAAIDDISTALNTQRQNPSHTMPCCLFGGIAPFILPWLGDELRGRIVERHHGATKGAILMLKQYMQQQGTL